MANTSIQIKKSGVTGNTPSGLGYGELAINYADKKLYFKNDGGTLSYINNQDTFATINANSTLILASGTTDTLSIAPGNNITISADSGTKTITINSTGGSDPQAGNTANAAFVQANAAFDRANTANISYTSSNTAPSTPKLGDQWYYIAEDIRYEYATDGSSFFWWDTASGSVTTADGGDSTARNLANTGISNAAGASLYANAAFIEANAAFLVANSGSAYANSAFNEANSAYTQANTGVTNAAAASSYANSAYNQANTATNDASGASLYANGAFIQANAAFIRANNSLDANNGGIVGGTVTFSRDVTVQGNLFVFGNSTTITTSQLDIGDSLIYLANNNFSSDAVDIGIIGHYNDGVNRHAGLVRDPNLKEWVFFKGYTPEVQANNLINIADPSFATSNVIASTFKGNVIANTVVSSTSLGVGTNAPSYSLHVNGPSAEYRTALFESSSTLGPSVQIKGSRIYELRSTNSGATEGANLFFIYDKTNEVSRLTVGNTGNIGINTTNPVAKLSVYANGVSPHYQPTGLSVSAGAGGGNLLALDAANNHNWFPYVDGNNYYSAGSHQFRSGIGNSTNFLNIGTSGINMQSGGLFINRSNIVGSGINWYSSGFTSWTDYMANAGTTNCGPTGNITAPSGTLVTSWAKRDFIENVTNYGWTWESGTSSGQPTVVAEIRSSDGTARFNGSVLAPNQPMFYAYGCATTATTTTGTWTFTSTRSNVGNNYSTSNGRFTAPIAGNYIFFGKALHRGANGSGQTEVTFFKNGANINTRGMGYTVNASTSGHTTVFITVTLALSAGDYIQFGLSAIATGPDIYLIEDLSSFSGYLIG